MWMQSEDGSYFFMLQIGGYYYINGKQVSPIVFNEAYSTLKVIHNNIMK